MHFLISKLNMSFLKKKTSFITLLILNISLISVLSYNNISFDAYFNYIYADYSNFFKTLDYSVFPNSYSTFPMWGYGLFHLLGPNKLIFLVIQQSATFFTLLYLDTQLIKFKLIEKIQYFRFLILISFPWFFFHTQMWEKSISSNLLLVTAIILIKFLKSKNLKDLIICSILLGILSNFRSDYNFLYIVIFILIIYFYGRHSIKNLYRSLIFPSIILLLLTPWMLFTYKQTESPLLSSTNTGHVLFIGLGQLPNNSWGITPVDHDKVMDSILKSSFKKNYKSYNYHENKYLKEKFIEYIKSDPLEWLKKCFFAFRLLILDPFYVGNLSLSWEIANNKDFANVKELRKLEKLVYAFDFKQAVELIKKTKWKISNKAIFQFAFTFFVKFQGRVLIFSFFISLFLCFKRFGFNLLKDKLILIMLMIVGFQMSISVFAFHMPVYNNSIYIIYLLLTYLFFQKYLSIKQYTLINE